MELLVVLFLSSLVFGAILLVFQIVQQQQRQQSKDYEEIAAVRQLKTLLQVDAFKAKEWIIEDRKLYCYYPTYYIEYHFEPQQLLRTIRTQISHTDTFALPTLDILGKWQEEEITFGPIDLLSWESRFFEQTFHVLIQKKYATQLLQH